MIMGCSDLFLASQELLGEGEISFGRPMCIKASWRPGGGRGAFGGVLSE